MSYIEYPAEMTEVEKELLYYFFKGMANHDPLWPYPGPEVVTQPVVHNPTQVTVRHGNVLYALVEAVGGGLLACEWLSDDLVAPGMIELK